jgi:hypothetical protein
VFTLFFHINQFLQFLKLNTILCNLQACLENTAFWKVELFSILRWGERDLLCWVPKKDLTSIIEQPVSKSKSHCDWRSVSKSWCRAPSGAYDQIFITVWQLRSCFCGALSRTGGRVCRLQLLLALASAVILGSEPLGTRDHILLSQIWDFPFRRLLRLAGSRWRYSTPPPHNLCQYN